MDFGQHARNMADHKDDRGISNSKWGPWAPVPYSGTHALGLQVSLKVSSD